MSNNSEYGSTIEEVFSLGVKKRSEKKSSKKSSKRSAELLSKIRKGFLYDPDT